jgi:hypothetical protein
MSLFEITRKEGGEPCGECHLQPGETCDICGAFQSAEWEYRHIGDFLTNRPDIEWVTVTDPERIEELRAHPDAYEMRRLSNSLN